MYRILLLTAAVLAVSGCARVIEGSTQRVTIETPGAENAVCYLTNDEIHYKIHAPQTIRITKTRDVLNVHCDAPGNRRKFLSIKPEIEEATYWNAVNGFLPGMYIDYESAALYKFPELIVVDFTGMPLTPYPRPDYDRILAENPNLGGYEEFRPGHAALIRDKYETTTPLARRELPTAAGATGNAVVTPAPEAAAPVESGREPVSRSSGATSYAPAVPVPVPAPASGGAESLTRQMNPHVFGGSEPYYPPATAPAPYNAGPANNFVGGTSADGGDYPIPLIR